MPQPNNKRKQVYDAMSKKYNMPSYEEFDSKMDNPDNRKQVYDAMSKKYNMPSYEEFESNVTSVKKKADSGFTSLSQKSDSEGQTGSLAGAENQNSAVEDKPQPKPNQTAPVSGMKTFDGFSDTDLKNMKGENKEPLLVSPLIKNKIKIKESKLKDELSNVEVTPENMDAVSAKTDELSALQKANLQNQYNTDEHFIQRLNTTDPKRIEDDLIDEKDDNQVSDYIREGAKYVGNLGVRVLNAFPRAINTASFNTLDVPVIDEFKEKIPFEKQLKQVRKEDPENLLSPQEQQKRAEDLFKEDAKRKQIEENYNNALTPGVLGAFAGDWEQKKNLQERLKAHEINKITNLDNAQKANSAQIQLYAGQGLALKQDIESDLAIAKTQKTDNAFMQNLSAKQQKFNEISDIYLSLLDAQSKIKNEKLSTEDHINLFKLDYDPLAKALDDTLSAFETPLGGALNLIGKSADAIRKTPWIDKIDYDLLTGEKIASGDKSALSVLGENLISDAEDRNKSHRAIGIGDIHSPSDLGTYVTQVFTTAAPYLVGGLEYKAGESILGSAAGTGFFMAGAGGKKAFDMDEEMKANPNTDYNNLQYLSAIVGYMGAEKLMLGGYDRIMKGAGTAIKSISKNPVERELFDNGIKTYFTNALKSGGKFISETNKSGMIGLTTATTKMATDNIALGKKSENPFNEMVDAYTNMAVMHLVMSATPNIIKTASYALNKVSEGKAKKQVAENYAKIKTLSEEFKNPDLTDNDKALLNDDLSSLHQANVKIIKKSLDKLGTFSRGQVNELLEIDQEKTAIRQQAKELKSADSGISEEAKPELLKSLKEKFDALENRKMDVFNNEHNSLELLSPSEQKRLMDIAKEELSSKTDEQGNEAEITEKDIKDKATAIHLEEDRFNGMDIKEIDALKRTALNELNSELTDKQKKNGVTISDYEITKRAIENYNKQIVSDTEKQQAEKAKESTDEKKPDEEKLAEGKPDNKKPVEVEPTQTANTPVEENKSIADPSEDVATITEDLSNPESVAPVTEVSPEAKGRGAKTTVKTQGKGKKITEPVTEATPETETKGELNNPVTEITPIAETTPESEAKEGTAPVVEPKTKSKSKSKKGLTNTENKTETTKETTPVAEELNSLENKNKPQKEATAKTTKTDKQVSETDKQAEKPTADESAQPQAKLTKAEKAKLAKEERQAKAQAIRDKHTDRANQAKEAKEQVRPETKETTQVKETEQAKAKPTQKTNPETANKKTDTKSKSTKDTDNDPLVHQSTHNKNNSLTSERLSHEIRTPKNTPKKLSEIIKDVTKGLKATLIYGRFTKRPVAGYYSPSNTIVRISRAGDIDTVAHEMGHLLDDRHKILDTAPQANVPKITSELKWFSERGGSNPPSKARKAEKIKYLQREGLAEFIRAYVANPTQAKRIAPELFDHFEKTIDAKTKDVLKQFSEDYIDYANSSAIDRIMANVQNTDLPNKNKFIEALKNFNKGSENGELNFNEMDKWYAQMTNSNHFTEKAFNYLVKDLLGKKDLKPSENFEIMSRLFLGIDARLENIFNKGMVNAKNERLKAEGGVFRQDENGRTITKNGTPINRKWLLDCLDQTNDKTLEEDMKNVISLGIAQRTLEYAYKFGRADGLTGIGGGLESDSATALKAMAKFDEIKIKDPAKYARIEEGLRRYRQMADTALRYAVEKGRISKEQYLQIKEGNQLYMALNRNIEIEPGEDVFGPFQNGGKTLGSSKKIINKSKGGTQEIENPYSSLFRNINNIIKEADRNEIMNTFVEPLRTIRNMEDGDPVNLAQIGRKVTKEDKNTISVYNNGKLEKWQFQDDIYKSLKNIESISDNKAITITSMIMLSNAIRWFVIHNPIFFARNIVRDTQNRLKISRNHSTVLDMFHTKADKDLFELSGGSQAGFLHTSKKAYTKMITQTAKEMTAKGGIIIDPRNFGEKYSKFLESGENLNRIAEFKAAYRQAKLQGLSNHEAELYAGFEARDLMDFAVAGYTMREINKIIPFSNAKIQGMRRAKKAIMRDPLSVAYGTIVYSMLPSYILAGLRSDNGDDKDYEELPDNQRDQFWNFRTKLTGDVWISIPKDQDLYIPSAIFDRAISKAKGYDNAFDGVVGSSLKSLLPINSYADIAGGLKPAFEVLFNKDTFSDRPIVPEYESNKLLELRTGKIRASQIGQKLSEELTKAKINIDPRNIDHLLKGNVPYFANQIMKATDIFANDQNKVNQWVTMTGFAKDVPTYNAKSVSKTTELASKLGKSNSASMKNLRKRIDKFSSETDPTKRKQQLDSIYIKSQNIYKTLENKEPKIFEKAKRKEDRLKAKKH